MFDISEGGHVSRALDYGGGGGRGESGMRDERGEGTPVPLILTWALLTFFLGLPLLLFGWDASGRGCNMIRSYKEKELCCYEIYRLNEVELKLH